MATIRHYYNFHHNDYFLSYSDTIMPTFLFVVGISFRFSLLRRLAKSTFLRTYAGYFRRSLALVLISVILNGIGQEFHDYQEFFSDPASGELAEAEWQQFEDGQADFAIPPHLGDRIWQWAKLFAKSYIWETLAVIGIVQLLVLPFVHLSFWKRFGVMVALRGDARGDHGVVQLAVLLRLHHRWAVHRPGGRPQ